MGQAKSCELCGDDVFGELSSLCDQCLDVVYFNKRRKSYSESVALKYHNGSKDDLKNKTKMLRAKYSGEINALLNIKNNIKKKQELDVTLIDKNPEWDVFISHASEDKDIVAKRLANYLRKSGLSVWYDEFELKIGDSLHRKIDSGIANSRFAVVVLSSAFFNKGWPKYELDGLVAKAVSGEQIILPIWHMITKQELLKHSPPLANIFALNTTTHTVEEIAQKIIEVVKAPNANATDAKSSAAD